PRAGRWAPDFTLPWLGGGAGVRLSDLWRSKPLVMEFGSFTLPYCSAEGPLLDSAAAPHPPAPRGVIYPREAHPGENVLHHDSFERKLACAKLLAEEAGDRPGHPGG